MGSETLMSRRERVGGGSTFRSEAPTPVSRRFTPAPSVECSPPPSSHRTPKAGRRASSGSGTPKPETYTPGGSTLQPPRSSARFGNSPALAEFSERRSTGRRSQQPTTRSILEARVNAEVGDIFKQVDADCGFNKADEQESYEARKIIEEGLADKKGAVEYQHRIRDVDLDGDGQIDESEKFVNQRSTHGEDKHNAFKVIYNMIMNLEKEYFSLNAHKTELESVHNLLDQAEKDGEDHLSMTKILTDVKKASIISYRVWEHLNHSLHHGVEDDMVGARKTLKF